MENYSKGIPEKELEYITKFLKRFVFQSDGKYQDLVDLNLALKALPCRIDKHNCFKVDLFNFKDLQTAIIGYQNSEQDVLFGFYDDKNKMRLLKLKEKAMLTKKLTKDLQELTNTILSILYKIGSMSSLSKIHTKKVDNLFIKPEQVE
jgi:hypothetical protein